MTSLGNVSSSVRRCTLDGKGLVHIEVISIDFLFCMYCFPFSSV